ncbi:hypothetical protein [Haloplanus salilacus]|uniref:hypothetical protein n=1 Tax=Haloplanus salilacus TaxID=2949994 RepID=UPI0030CFAF3A
MSEVRHAQYPSIGADPGSTAAASRRGSELGDVIGVVPSRKEESIYTPTAGGTTTQMIESPSRAVVFACYQLTLVLGIALMPVALLTRRFGVTLPLGEAVAAAGRAYENAA